MNKESNPLLKHYGGQRSRTLQSALTHRLSEDFPRIGGPRILDLCAQMIMEVVDQHSKAYEHLRHGQIVWSAIDIDDRPRRGQTGAQTRKVPVILTLHDLSDVEDCIKHPRPTGYWPNLRLKRVLRMSNEAYAQGGLLSNVDLSLLLGVCDGAVARLISAWEDANDKILPRRTTVHDVGSGVTHKRIICRKRHLEGKEPPQVARETYHTLESVDRYLGQYDRVRHCRQQGMSPQQTAHILQCGEALVKQYLKIDEEINAARQTQPSGLPKKPPSDKIAQPTEHEELEYTKRPPQTDDKTLAIT